MKDHARGIMIGSIVLMLALPILYIGSEGVWYLATGESHFRAGSAYRRIYAPLDAMGDRFAAVDDARRSLADLWLGFGSDPRRRAYIRNDPEEFICVDAETLWVD